MFSVLIEARMWPLFMILCIVQALAQPRPSMPQYMFIDNGEFACLHDDGGPPCAGISYGQIVGRWQFDDQGWYQNYREDSILLNTSLVYNREYADVNGTSEFFLYGDSATSLSCVSFYAPIKFSRHFITTAKYVGQTQVKGEKVYEFIGQWNSRSSELNITAWVSVNTEQIFGLLIGSARYIYHHYLSSDPFNTDIFKKPNITCTKAKPNQLAKWHFF